jgi:hypothetical protein
LRPTGRRFSVSLSSEPPTVVDEVHDLLDVAHVEREAELQALAEAHLDGLLLDGRETGELDPHRVVTRREEGREETALRVGHEGLGTLG